MWMHTHRWGSEAVTLLMSAYRVGVGQPRAGCCGWIRERAEHGSERSSRLLASCDEKKGRKVMGRGPGKEELMRLGDE